MLSVIILNLAVIAILVGVASRRGLEQALPYFTVFVVIAPEQSQFKLPGLFDINTQRVSLITLVVLYLTANRKPESTGIPLRHLMLASIGWLVISTVNSLQFGTSLKQLIAQGLEYYLLYFMLVRVISKADTVRRIAFGMVVGIGVCCVFGCLEVYFKWSVLSLFPQLYEYFEGAGALYAEMGDRGLRVRSTFPHPILFGDAIAMMIPLAFYLAGVSKNTFQKKVLWVSIILMFWNIYKTSSRGPWLATGMSLALLFFLLRNKTRKYLLTIGVLTAAVLVVRPGVWETISSMYSSSFDRNTPMGSSYEYRYAVWNSVLKAEEADSTRALWGHGLGTFRKLGLEVEIPNAPELSHRWYTCDNNWALFLYETGLGGLGMMAVLLAKALMLIFGDFRRLPRPDRDFSGVLFVSLLSFYFLMTSVAAYGWGQSCYMLWIVIAIGIAYGRVQQHEQSLATSSDSGPGAATLTGEPEMAGSGSCHYDGRAAWAERSV